MTKACPLRVKPIEDVARNGLARVLALVAILALPGVAAAFDGGPARPEFAYVPNELSDTVSGFTVDPVTGALAEVAGSPFPSGNGPIAAVVHSSGNFLYVANFRSNNISAYAIDERTGVLTPLPGSLTATRLAPTWLAVHPSGRFLYAANSGAANVSAFAVDEVTGALSEVPGSPFAAGSFPYGIAIHPGGRFAYVTNAQSNSITIYAVDDASGALAAVGTAGAGSGPVGISIDSTGTFALVAHNGGRTIVSHRIDPLTGSLTSVSSLYLGGAPQMAPAIALSGRFAYATGDGLRGYTIDPATATLGFAPGSPYEGSYRTAVADVSGRYVYAAVWYSTRVDGYALGSDGALSPLSGSPFTSGSSPGAMATTFGHEPAGGAHVVSLTLSPADPVLRFNTFGRTVQLLATATYSDGTTRFATDAADWSSSTTSVATVTDVAGAKGLVSTAGYGVATITATLDGIDGSTTVTSNPATLTAITIVPSSPTIAPGPPVPLRATGTYGDGTTRDITGLVAWSVEGAGVASVDGGGRVTGLAGGTTLVRAAAAGVTGTATLTVTGTAGGNVLFALDAQGATVSSYRLDPSSGGLLPDGVRTSQTAADPEFVALDPRGRFAYVVNREAGLVSGYGVDVFTGGLTPLAGSPWRTARYAGDALVEPGGRYLYVVNYTNPGGIYAYRIEEQTGALSVVPGSPFAGEIGALSAAIDPSGRYLYVLSYVGPSSSSLITVYSIGADGTLTKASPSPFLTGRLGEDLLVHPSGRFLYAVHESGVSTIAIDGAMLRYVSTASAGRFPLAADFAGGGRFLYVAVYDPSSIVGLAVDAATGELSPLPGSPYAAGDSPQSIAAEASGRFVYAATRFGTRLTAHAIGSNGALTPVPGSPFDVGHRSVFVTTSAWRLAPGATATSLQVVPEDATVRSSLLGQAVQFSAIASFSDGSSQFVTDSVDWSSADAGVATLDDPVAKGLATTTGFGATQVTARLGSLAGSATLTTLAPLVRAVRVLPGPATIRRGDTRQFAAIALHEDGTSEDVTAGVAWSSAHPRVASVAAGGLVSALGTGRTTIAAALGSIAGSAALSVTPGEGFVYVANSASDSVSAFRASETGGLTPVAGSPFTAGDAPQALAVDPFGRFLFVANWGSASLSAYAIQAGTGALSSVPGSPFPTGATPSSVAVDASGRWLYATSLSNGTVTAYAVDPASGALAPVGSPVATGSEPRGVAVDPAGRFVYVANARSNDVSGYRVDDTTGALTPIPGSPFASYPLGGAFGLAVDPAGRFVFLTNNFTGGIQTFAINQDSGGLKEATFPASGLGSVGLGVDAGGKFAYLASTEGLRGFRFDAQTGALAMIAGSPFGSIPLYGVAVDPTAHFVHATSATTNTVRSFAIDETTGAVESVGVPTGTGVHPQAIVATAGRRTDDDATLVGLDVTPPDREVVAPRPGRSLQFEAVGHYSDGTEAYVTALVEWASSDPAVATISNAVGASGLAATTGFGSTTITATIGGLSASTLLRSTRATLVSLRVAPASASVPAGTTLPITAWGTYSEGTLLDVTAMAAWASSDPGVATIGGDGLATAVGSGRALISATLESLSATMPLVVHSTAGFAYVANRFSQDVSGFRLDGASGGLTPLPGSPFPAGGGARAVWAHPSGRFLYVANTTDGTVSAYTVDGGDGALTPVEGSPFRTGLYPYSLATDPEGRFLYVGSYIDSTISAFLVDPVSGALAQQTGSPFTAEFGLLSLAPHPAGRYLFALSAVGNMPTSRVTTYRIDPASGGLAAVAVASAPPNGTGMAADPLGRFVFVAHNTGVSAFTLDPLTGSLAPAGTWPAGSEPNAVAVDPTGRFVYVASVGSSDVSVFAVESTSGHLSPIAGSPFAGVSFPTAMATEAAGRFALAVDANAGTLKAWGISPGSGGLVGPPITVAAGNSPFGLAVLRILRSPTAALVALEVRPGDSTLRTNLVGRTKQFVAVGTYSDGTVHFLTDSVTWSSSDASVATFVDAPGSRGLATTQGWGTATVTATAGPVQGSTSFTVSTALIALRVSPPNSVMARGTARQLTAVAVNDDGTTEDVTSGVAWSVANTDVAAVDASGRVSARAAGRTTVTARFGTLAGMTPLSVGAVVEYAYLANPDADSVSAYRIDPATGALSPVAGSPFPAGDGPQWAVVDPSGRFVYVPNRTAGTISSYRIDPATGALSPLPGSPVAVGSNPYSGAVDPDGRFLFVCHSVFPGRLSAFRIDAASGELSPVAGSPFATGAYPTSLAVDPAGQNLYVAMSGTGQVAGYRIDASGALAPLPGSPYPVGSGPIGVAVDPSGHFLYSGQNGAGTIVGLAIGGSGALASTGNLTGVQLPYAPVAIDPGGRFAFFASNGGAEAFTLNRATGALARVAGSPFLGDQHYQTVALDRTATFAYFTTWFSDGVAAFHVDPATGALKPIAGSPFRTAAVPFGVAITGGPATAEDATLVSLELTPPETAIVSRLLGRTRQFEVVGTFSDGTRQYLSASASWTTSDPGAATVENAPGAAGLATTTGFGEATITATYGSLSASAALRVTRARLLDVRLVPNDAVLKPGASMRFTALGTYEDGSIVDLGPAAAWSSSRPEVASVDGGGQVRAIAPGRTTVTASAEGLSSQRALVVHTLAGFVYAADENGNRVYAFRSDAATGALTPVAGSPFAAGPTPRGLAVDVSGRFLYVANRSAATVSGYAIEPSGGGLTPIGPAVASGREPYSLAAEPSGRFLYVVNYLERTVSAYRIDAATGRLTEIPGSPFTTAIGPQAVVADPTGRYLIVLSYVGPEATSNLSVYRIDLASGALAPVADSPFTTDAQGKGLAIDPFGRYVHAVHGNGVALFALDGATGALTALGPASSGGSIPVAAVTDAFGRFVYVSSYGSSRLYGYALDRATGTLAPIPGSAFGGVSVPTSLASDSAARYLYAANLFGGVSAFAVNATSGALTAVTGSPFPAEGRFSAVAMAPVILAPTASLLALRVEPGETTFASAVLGKTVQLRAIATYDDGSTQYVTPAVTWRSSAEAVATVSDSAATKGLATTSGFGMATITATLGGMTASATLHVGMPGITSIRLSPATTLGVVDSTRRFEATASYAGGGTENVTALASWSSSDAAVARRDGPGLFAATGLGRATVSAALGGAVGTASFTVTNGDGYAYFVDSESNRISAFRVSGATGSTTPVTGSPFATGGAPRHIAVTPSGRFAYVANEDSGTVSAYRIGGQGELSPVPGSPFAAGSHPMATAVDSDGRFAYVVNGASATVSGFSIDPESGALTPRAGSPFPTVSGARSVAMHPSGRFLFVGSPFASSVAVHRIDPATGGLSQVEGSPFAVSAYAAFKLTADPLGEFLYGVSNGSGRIVCWRIDGAGALSETSVTFIGLGYGPLVIEPTATRAYYPDTLGASAYAIDRATGALTALADSPYGTDRQYQYAALDSSSRFLFSSVWNANAVRGFRIDSPSGALVPFSGTFDPGFVPDWVATAPRVPLAAIALSGLTHVYDGTPRAATATTDPSGLSGLTITYDGSTAPPTEAGTYAVVASLVNADYQADPVTATLTIGKADQHIEFPALPGRMYGDAPFDPGAQASSGLVPVYAASGRCGFDDGAVRLTGAGSCTVTASQPGNRNYSPAGDVSRSFDIAKTEPTVMVAGGTFVYDGAFHPAAATAHGVFGEALSPLSITYDGSPVAPIHAGTFSALAVFAGNDDYRPGSASASIVIRPAPQVIAFDPLPDRTFGEAPVALAASASSGLPVSFSAAGRCASSGSLLTLAGAGDCAVTASQPGQADWEPAADVVRTFTIHKAAATLTLGGLSRVYDGKAMAVLVTTEPPGLEGVTVAYDGGPTPPTHAGDYAVEASLSHPDYAAAVATGTLVIARAPQDITFGAPPDRTFGDAPVLLAATASSGLPVSFDATGPCAPSGGLLTLTGAGACTVTAAQAGNGDWKPAADVARSFTIRTRTPHVTWPTPAALTYGVGLSGAQLNASADVAGTFAYDPGAGTLLPPGTSTLRVTFTPEDTRDFATVSASVEIRVIVSWSNVLRPINPAGTSLFQLGRTIPVKFELTGGSAGIGTLAAFLYVSKASDGIVGSEEEAVSTSAADTGNRFRYDASGAQYIFNLSTMPFTPGTYQLRIDLGDGVSHTVLISSRK